MFAKTSSFSLLALLAASVSAQTHTLCSPMKQDCPPAPALGGSISIDYTKGKSADSTGFFKELDGTSFDTGSDGAMFKIEKLGQAPTVVSNKYIFFGRLDVEVKVAPGTGIVSSIVLQSDDLDEIDWEWLGGKTGEVQTNYFSKGDDSTYDRGGIHPVSNPMSEFHTYSIDWTQDRIQWIINGAVIRELKYADAKGGATFPQQPCQVRLGSWVGGSPSNPQGTIDWAGGLTNFAEGPFIGYYKSIKVTDYMGGKSSATQYVYGDRSGKWESVIVESGSGSSSSSSVSSSKSADSSTTKAPSTSGTATAQTTLSTSASTRGSGNSTSGSTTGSGGSGTGTGTGSSAGSQTTDARSATSAPSAAGITMPNTLLMGATLLLSYLAL